ncbi:MAG: murein hydrolase activator EnvC family protein [Patescibacteria group bacterium]
MKNRNIKIIILTLIFGGLLSSVPFVFSQTSNVDAEIDALNQKILNQKKQIDSLRAKQQEYQLQIQAKQKDKVNLSNQLSLLENRLAKAQLDIESTNLEIGKTDLEIKKIEIDSKNLDTQIETQKEHISNLLRLVYKQDQISTLEMLLLNNSLSEFLNQAKYLEDTNQEIGESVADLRSDKERLDSNRKSLDEKNTELVSLKNQLEEKKSNLAYDQESKISILEETKSSERQFQSLLLQAKREQDQAAADIANAESLIRKKMSQKEQQKLNSGNNTIAWPVARNTITTLFHDADYPYRRLIGEHSGVDIRAKQGSSLLAAADGYVAKVKFDGSTKYAYIMIIHGNGLATVYGHISAAYVTQDQYVTQGQAIGRTGGMPGGIGTGPFSSGPHLHFEVRKDGLPVDPQKYLR